MRTSVLPDAPAPGGGTTSVAALGVEDQFASRFRRLTPREVRLLILVVEDGLGYADLAKALGVGRGNIAGTMQSIRRKLAVPRMKDLADFVRSTRPLNQALSAAKTAPPPRPAALDRRERDLLRMTITELQTVAATARRRATALDRLHGGGDVHGDPTSTEEAHLLRDVSELAGWAANEAVRIARRSS